MGYYTNYNLTAKNNDDTMVDIEKINNFLDDCYGFEASDTAEWELSEAKWYDHIEDLKKLSTMCGEKTLFYLHGEGEENGDVWDEYYRNGKMIHYKPEVIWPKFKETDLQ